jgi:hypothetical protein
MFVLNPNARGIPTFVFKWTQLRAERERLFNTKHQTHVKSKEKQHAQCWQTFGLSEFELRELQRFDWVMKSHSPFTRAQTNTNNILSIDTIPHFASHSHTLARFLLKIIYHMEAFGGPGPEKGISRALLICEQPANLNTARLGMTALRETESTQ